MNNPILFVSLGPGEPELITLKGLKALQAADCIFCPATTTLEGKTLSRSADILLELGIGPGFIRRFELPMSKNREKAFEAYEGIYDIAGELAAKGKKVVITAEGDAGFYSSVHYIYDKFRTEGIETACIAGIPAFIAAGAMAGLHVASQEERMVVIPGVITAEEVQNFLEQETVVVIMKLSQCTDEIHRCVEQHPQYVYHYFENVGTEKEYYSCNTEELKNKKYPYFSIMMIRN